MHVCAREYRLCILACHPPRRNGDPSVKKILNRPADFVVEASAALVSRRGRAAWIGERGQGSRDAGAVAWLRLLEAVIAADG